MKDNDGYQLTDFSFVEKFPSYFTKHTNNLMCHSFENDSKEQLYKGVGKTKRVGT